MITVIISYGSLPEKAPPIKLFRPPPWRSHRRGRLTDIQSLVSLSIIANIITTTGEAWRAFCSSGIYLWFLKRRPQSKKSLTPKP